MTRQIVEVPEFGYKDVEEAYERLRQHLAPTPVVQSYYLGGTRVALVISGGNIDGPVLDEVLREY